MKTLLINDKNIFKQLKKQKIKYDIITDIDNSKLEKIIGILTVKKNYKKIQNIIPKLKNLKVVGITGCSLSSLNLDYLFKNNIYVINTSNIYAKSCSEFLLMLCILGIRRASLSHDVMKKGIWGIQKFNGSNGKREPVDKSFYSSTIGILGFGCMTSEFLKLLKPFNNTIKLYSENTNLKQLNYYHNNIKLTNSENTLNSDIVIINRGLSSKTKHSFGKNEINKLKPGTILINISRGPIIDNQYLYQRLLKNDIFACLDVFDKEPIDKDFKFSKLPNVFLTSHLAGSSKQIEKDSYMGICQNVLDFLNNGCLSNVVSKKRYENSHVQNIS